MKYRGSKITLGILLILLSFFTVKDISFANAEATGYSIVPLVLIIGGLYLIYKGTRDTKKDLSNF